MYITLQQAKDHLRITDNLRDQAIRDAILEASALIKNYLGDASVYVIERDSDGDPIRDSNYEPITTGSNNVRYAVQAATKLLVGVLYDGHNLPDDNYLPAPVRALLYPLRSPVVE